MKTVLSIFAVVAFVAAISMPATAHAEMAGAPHRVSHRHHVHHVAHHHHVVHHHHAHHV